MLEARRYRAHLTVEQSARASEWLDAQRALWNLGVEHRRMVWEQFRGHVLLSDQMGHLTELRGEYEWFRDVPAQCQQQLLRDLDAAYRWWWNGSHGKPTWRKKDKSTAGIRFPGQGVGGPRKINRRWGEVRLLKLGWVRFRRTRALGGTVRNVTLKRDRAGDWWVSILVETGVDAPELRVSGPVVGIDRGVNVSAYASDGRLWQSPEMPAKERERLVRLQRQLRRREKGSARWERARLDIVRIYRRDTARRSDWAHKVSAELVAGAAVVGFEDLQVDNLVRSASGTVDNPGRNVSAKRSLTRAILVQGWGSLHEFTEYKGRRVGCQVVKVPAQNTSRRCSACGYTDERNRDSQAFRCLACGHEDHADRNAAINVEIAARQAVTGRGDFGVTRSVKRQPSGAAESSPGVRPDGSVDAERFITLSASSERLARPQMNPR